MERIKKVLEKYTPDDAEAIRDTVDMLCSKGIPNGCFQDYTILLDVLEILSICKTIIEKGDNK